MGPSTTQGSAGDQALGISSDPAPWPPETDHLLARLTAISLQALAAEGTALHTHQHLDIFVHGRPVLVPAGIGIHDTLPPFLAPIHTHDDTGIVHVESPAVEAFHLGQFLDIWGVSLSSTSIGGYAVDATNALSVYADGKLYTGDPRQLELVAHEEIVIIFGTASEAPSPIPSNYPFPAGY